MRNRTETVSYVFTAGRRVLHPVPTGRVNLANAGLLHQLSGIPGIDPASRQDLDLTPVAIHQLSQDRDTVPGLLFQPAGEKAINFQPDELFRRLVWFFYTCLLYTSPLSLKTWRKDSMKKSLCNRS